jgi:2-dehydropantoate 2-reductase
MSGKYDIVFLMTKQLDNKAVVTALTKFLNDDGVICTMQNGLPEHSVSEVIGEERTYGCAIGWGAQMTEHGVSELTSEPDALVFALGAYNKAFQKDPHFKEIVRLLSIMGKVEIEDNFIGVRWSKLLVNSAFSGMSAVLGCNFGEVADNKTSRRCAQRIIKEIIDSTRKGGIKIEPIQARM